MPVFAGWAGWTNDVAGIILRDAAVVTMTAYVDPRILTGELTTIGNLVTEIGSIIGGLEARTVSHAGITYAAMTAAYTVNNTTNLNSLCVEWFNAYHNSVVGGFSTKP